MSADVTTLAQESNAFAVDLYSKLSTAPGNLFFSPASVSSAFSMAYAGARGATASQMASTLHFALPPDRLHPAMGALLAQLNGPHENYELHMANALWAGLDRVVYGATIEDANRHCKQIHIPAEEVAQRSEMPCVVEGEVLRDLCYGLFTDPRMLKAFKTWTTRRTQRKNG